MLEVYETPIRTKLIFDVLHAYPRQRVCIKLQVFYMCYTVRQLYVSVVRDEETVVLCRHCMFHHTVAYYEIIFQLLTS